MNDKGYVIPLARYIEILPLETLFVSCVEEKFSIKRARVNSSRGEFSDRFVLFRSKINLKKHTHTYR